jgi:hypothetical protein
MKNKIIAALIALSTMGGLAAALPTTAQAYVGIGPCLLRAQVPVPNYPGDGGPQGEGQITNCSSGILGLTNHTLRLQSCIQVQTPSGGWATKSETCQDSGTFKGSGVNEFPTGAWASPRRFRTWVWGCADGNCATYQSGYRDF